MNPTQVHESLIACIKAGRPAYISGSPGIGKSDVVRQVATELGATLFDERASTTDPVDWRGLPSMQDGKTVWNIPEILTQLEGHEGRVIFFLDELLNAATAIQSALLQLALDRRLGKFHLSDNVSVVAAGNRVQDRAGSGKMISSLADRFVHIEFEPDHSAWIAWALNAGIATEIIAFIRFRPELLNQFDARETVNPTPRSWKFVSDLMPHVSPEIEFDLISGTVGQGASAEFCAFLKIARELPDPDSIIMDPTGAIVPSQPASLYALCGALAHRASEHTAQAIVTYSARIPAEFSVLMVSDSVRKAPEFTQTRAYQQWASDNNSVLI